MEKTSGKTIAVAIRVSGKSAFHPSFSDSQVDTTASALMITLLTFTISVRLNSDRTTTHPLNTAASLPHA